MKYSLLLAAILSLSIHAQSDGGSCPSCPDGQCDSATMESCGSCQGSFSVSDMLITNTGTTVVVPPGLGIFINAVIEEEGSSEVVVSFSLMENSDVVLSLNDLQGEPIRLITDGFYDMGNYRVTFDAGDLDPGMYIVRLDAMGGYAYNRIFLLRK